MRDYMVLTALLFFIPMAFSNALAGYLLWGWTAVIAIDSYTFGLVPTLRLNLIFAVITLLAMLVYKDKERGTLSAGGTSVLLILFLLHATLAAIFAYPGNSQNWDLYSQLLKTMVFVLVMPLVLSSRYRIHAMMLMLVLGLSFHGLVEGLKFIVTGGGHHVRGVAKFGDNNHFAVALAMSIPCMYYLVQTSRSKLIRLGAIVVSVITVLAIVGTSSRGGMLCIAAMGIWLAMTSRRKLVATLFVLMCAGLVVALAPESWTERMDTIKTAEQDGSFMQRVEAWQVSSAIAVANPVFGGGFRAIEVQEVWNQFRGSVGFLGFMREGPPSEIFRAAHSVYFQIMGDLGLLGLVLFLTLLGNVFLMRRNIHKRAKVAGAQEWQWAIDLSNALAASMFAYMVGGAAVSLGYFETMYMIVMLMAVLQRHILSETKKPEEVRL